MNLRELKALITNHIRGKRLPSYKQLQEAQLPIILQLNIESSELNVYNNGLITYSNLVSGKIHHTVFSISKLELRYEYSKHSYAPINLSDYPEFDEYDAAEVLMMCGQDRIDYNTNSRENSHASKYLDDSGEYHEKKENTRKKLSLPEPDFTDAIIDRLEPAQELDEHELLKKALNHLTQKQLEVVRLHFLEQLTQEEIAQQLGIARPSVQSRLDGAIKKLKKCMNTQ